MKNTLHTNRNNFLFFTLHGLCFQWDKVLRNNGTIPVFKCGILCLPDTCSWVLLGFSPFAGTFSFFGWTSSHLSLLSLCASMPVYQIHTFQLGYTYPRDYPNSLLGFDWMSVAYKRSSLSLKHNPSSISVVFGHQLLITKRVLKYIIPK